MLTCRQLKQEEYAEQPGLQSDTFFLKKQKNSKRPHEGRDTQEESPRNNLYISRTPGIDGRYQKLGEARQNTLPETAARQLPC